MQQGNNVEAEQRAVNLLHYRPTTCHNDAEDQAHTARCCLKRGRENMPIVGTLPRCLPVMLPSWRVPEHQLKLLHFSSSRSRVTAVAAVTEVDPTCLHVSNDELLGADTSLR